MAKAAFLLGSGISLDSGAPSVGKITASLLDGEWTLHSGGTYGPKHPNQGSYLENVEHVASRAQSLVRLLKEQIDPLLFARESRKANYEDLFECLEQVVQDQTLEMLNPMIASNTEELRSVSTHLHSGQTAHIDDNSFASLADRATDLIQWVVYHELVKAAEPVAMDLIPDAVERFDEVDLFSLNHANCDKYSCQFMPSVSANNLLSVSFEVFRNWHATCQRGFRAVTVIAHQTNSNYKTIGGIVMHLIRSIRPDLNTPSNHLQTWFRQPFEGMHSWPAMFDWNSLWDDIWSADRLKADLFEHDKAYHVRMELPGVNKKDVRVEIENAVLTVSIEDHATAEKNGSSAETIMRSVAIPDGFDPDKVSAKLKEGMLHVMMPKTEGSKPRSIKVK